MKPSFQSSILCTIFFLGLSYQEDRKPRMFSLFNVVKFKNSACQSTSTADLQGVCHTKQECTDGGGMTDGNCAAGFGSCCVFIISGTTDSCGGTVTRNCSYIENPEFPATRATAGTCAFMVTRCSSDICQIRLDFKSTTRIGDPSAVATTEGTCDNSGLVIAPGATTTVGNSIPTLCGSVTGQHMYVDAGSATNAATLTFTTIVGGTQMWRIKVSQIECSSATRAPNGCLQYFLGETNTVKSYNWDGTNLCAPGCQLASQDYNVCFRTEAGMCGINYTPTTTDGTMENFQLATKLAADLVKAQQTTANCGLTSAAANAACGTALTDICSFIQIPNSNAVAEDIYCGGFLNVDDDAVVDGVITSNMKPFRFRHAVYGASFVNGAAAVAGFSIDTTQVPC